MTPLFSRKYSGIISRQKLIGILKEVFRKSIHLCSAFVPCFLWAAHFPTLLCLSALVVFYSVAEIVRLNGKEVFLISAVTEAAARKRDENKFVLGPVTLVLGIISSALLWEKLPAAIGIYALAFGDGLASLSGKLFGRVHIPFTEGKTVAGSLTCFAAIFISCYAACFFMIPQHAGITMVALIVAAAGMFIELLPLKDFDNLLIPILLGGLSQYLLCNL
ncbi:diacylglycerol/polyprenol kinase family protein [Treponema sp.]|uniref:diacylglycerol/polyprenol kinase family protein n=1 Tax=Treponema sp. TaxID=166 RepID=UPI003F0C26AA